MKDKINELIYTIPDEIRDCFAIEIKPEDANELRYEINLGVIKLEKDITFPCYIKNIPVFIGKSYNPKIRPIETKESIQAIYNYEINKFNKFIEEFKRISNKYKCFIGGCGWCSSPYIEDFYTFNVCDIKINEHECTYDLYIKGDYKKFLGDK